jgi:hypothetical protein
VKFRLLLLTFFAGLLLLPSTVRAQQNCSAITFQLQTAPSTAHDCSTPSINPLGNSYTTTFGFHVTCNNTQSGTIYQTNDITLAGVGHCGPLLTGVILDCKPSYTWSKTVPSTAGGTYNQLFFQALDNQMSGGSSPCVPINGATNFVQCLAQACQTAPPHCTKIQTCTDGNVWDNTLCACVQGGSPILLDIDGKGFNLTSADSGVMFDISGTGHPIQMGWTAPGSDNAFLCLPDSDGRCDDGKDLFGNFTPQPPSDTPNGFAALAVYDTNHDGVIDARDAIFSSLRLWIDANHDGVSQPEELHTLTALGVNSISLTYKASEKTDQYGNVFRYRAKVNPDAPDASRVDRTAYDVFFVVLNPSGSTKNMLTNPDGPKCAVPTSTRGGMLSTTGALR